MSRSAAIRIEHIREDEQFARLEGVQPESPVRFRYAADGDAPARCLPAQLQRDIAEAAALGAFNADFDPRPVEGKWSHRKTLAFVVVTCGAFWAGLAWAIATLF